MDSTLINELIEKTVLTEDDFEGILKILLPIAQEEKQRKQL